MDSFLRVAANISGAEEGTARQLGQLLTVVDDDPSLSHLTFHSTLNNDGSPVQLCVSANRYRHRCRLIGDAAAMTADPIDRLPIAYHALKQLLLNYEATALGPFVNDLFRIAIPTAPGQIGLLKHGLFWMAAGLNTKGVAIYCTPEWDDSDARWIRAIQWLKDALPDMVHASALIGALHHSAVLAAIGIEGTSPQDVRLKLYWRLGDILPLDALGVRQFCDTAFRDFLDHAIGDQVVSRSGLVFSASFDASSGILLDAKVDICAHCLNRTPADWVRTIQSGLTLFGLSDMPVAKSILARECDVAFWGLGIDQNGDRRMNLYLKMPDA